MSGVLDLIADRPLDEIVRVVPHPEYGWNVDTSDGSCWWSPAIPATWFSKVPDSERYQFAGTCYPELGDDVAREVARRRAEDCRGRPTRVPRGGWMVGGDQLAIEDRLPERRTTRQVNVRLSDDDFSVLEKAAAIYGLRPTALARLLINRGARAVTNAYDEERRELLEPR